MKTGFWDDAYKAYRLVQWENWNRPVIENGIIMPFCISAASKKSRKPKMRKPRAKPVRVHKSKKREKNMDEKLDEILEALHYIKKGIQDES